MKTEVFKRVLIALALAWMVLAGIYAINDADTEASRSAGSWLSICKNFSPESRAGDEHCSKSEDQLYADSWTKQGIWFVLITMFGPLIFLFAVWVVAYVLTRIFWWVKSGTFKYDPTVNYRKKAFITSATILALMGIWVFYVGQREDRKERAVGACKVQAIEKGFESQNDKRNRYIEACMKSKGYELRAGLSCYDGAEYPFCYR